MTSRQAFILNKAREKITELRNMLDDVMYHTTPQLSDKEFHKVREAYDNICAANDKLP